MTKAKRAPRTYIECGHHSIDRVTPTRRPDGTWTIDWSVRLESGRLLTKRTQAPTKTLLRARAKRAAERLLTSGTTEWKPSTPSETFIDRVTVPGIESAGLADSTKRIYLTATDRLKAQLRGLAVVDAATYGQAQAALQAVAAQHGFGAAKSAKQVYTRYFVGPLLAHGTITTSPISREHPIDITTTAKATTRAPRGSADLTTAHWRSVVKYLLEVDPAEGVEPPKRGRWTLGDRIAVRRGAIDQALLQCGTGLRLQEATGQAWEDFEDRDGPLWLTTTHPKPVRYRGQSVRRPRTIPVLLPEVAEHLRGRQAAAASPWVLPAPNDPTRSWGASAAKEAMGALYVELAETLGIDPLRTLRGHAWRSVINREMLARGIEVADRVAYLGHTEGVNAASYTHGRTLEAVRGLVGDL